VPAMLRLLFVCVENSCRSQMAEGFARAIGRDRVEAYSAGSRPSGEVDERAIAFMSEVGIGLVGQRSKGLNDLPPGAWDYIVTMGCGDACPNLPAHHRTMTPASATSATRSRAAWPRSSPTRANREIENADYFKRTSFLVWLKDPACIRLKYTPLATWFPR